MVKIKEDDIQREVFSTRVNPEKIKKIKYLSVDLNRPVYSLVEEALELLLKKYKK